MAEYLGCNGALPYSKGRDKTPQEILSVQVFPSTTNHTVNVLHPGRSPTSSVDGEKIPRSFERWSDTSCVAESSKEGIHSSGGDVCVGFDKAEFTNTMWVSSPKFCYISLVVQQLSQCKGAELWRQMHSLVEILGWSLERSILTESPTKPSQTLRVTSLQSTCEPGYYSMHIQMAKTVL